MNNNSFCVALGDFDGVHIGHRAVISAAVNNTDDLTPIVYTFTQNCKGAPSITDNKTKERLLISLGIKEVVFADFEKVRTLTPVQFVNDILVTKLHAKIVVCGDDYRFGNGAAGDALLLNKLCQSHGISVITVKLCDFADKKISSSCIRSHIEMGEMEKCKKMLGRNYSVSGVVSHGKRLGSANSTPTVNIYFGNHSVIPAYGVYISRTHVDGSTYNSITNVGVRPSVEDADRPNAETNIFDFSGDLYGKEIELEFIKMLRPERKFENTSLLYGQIHKDINIARSYFGENNDKF